MNKNALVFLVPGGILFLWAVIWGYSGFYSSQAFILAAIAFAGAALLFIGAKIQKKAENEKNRGTFGDE